jgi:hypothetical protein
MVPQALAMSSLRHPSAFILTPQPRHLIRQQRYQHVIDHPHSIRHEHYSPGLSTKKRAQFTALRAFVNFRFRGELSNTLRGCTHPSGFCQQQGVSLPARRVFSPCWDSRALCSSYVPRFWGSTTCSRLYCVPNIRLLTLLLPALRRSWRVTICHSIWAKFRSVDRNQAAADGTIISKEKPCRCLMTSHSHMRHRASGSRSCKT